MWVSQTWSCEVGSARVLTTGNLGGNARRAAQHWLRAHHIPPTDTGIQWEQQRPGVVVQHLAVVVVVVEMDLVGEDAQDFGPLGTF